MTIRLSHCHLGPLHHLIVYLVFSQPEKRVYELTHVLPVSVTASYHIVPLFKLVHKNIHSVSPIFYPFVNTTLLEESHQNVSQLFFKWSYFNHFLRVFKDSDLVSVPVVEIKVEKSFRSVFIYADHFFFRLLLVI